MYTTLTSQCNLGSVRSKQRSVPTYIAVPIFRVNVRRNECCSVGEVGAGESAAMAMTVGETSGCVRLRNDED